MADVAISPFFLDSERLQAIARERAAAYRSASPYPYAVIDDFLPPAVADDVAAVAVFGNPRSAHAASLAGGAPLPVISPLYAPKTIDQCVPDDPICSEPFNFLAFFAHDSYAFSGMANDAAKFAAGRL